jgi:hypothetical protein
MVKIKKIGVVSLGKIFGILYAIIGLIIGAIMTLVSVIGIALSSKGPGLFGALFGVGAIIFLPIFYGIMGFVGGLVMALLYNLIASWVGGLEVEMEK